MCLSHQIRFSRLLICRRKTLCIFLPVTREYIYALSCQRPSLTHILFGTERSRPARSPDGLASRFQKLLSERGSQKAFPRAEACRRIGRNIRIFSFSFS